MREKLYVFGFVMTWSCLGSYEKAPLFPFPLSVGRSSGFGEWGHGPSVGAKAGTILKKSCQEYLEVLEAFFMLTACTTTIK